jgi:imidazolonepropionase-like amidohydrolase
MIKSVQFRWSRPLRIGLFIALPFAMVGAATTLSAAAELLPPGHRQPPPGVHALTGGRVVTRPGQVLESATVVIRDGLIESVGPEVEPPADARVWDLKGATIYAGLIDPYLALGASNPPVLTTAVEPIDAGSGVNFFGVPGQERDPGGAGPGHGLGRVVPQTRAAETYTGTPATLRALRELGFTAANIVPTRGILRGTSAFVMLSDVNPNQAILRPDVFHHVAFEREGGREDEYPGSLMGIIAAVRQAFFDAQHYALDHADHQRRPAARKRPDFNPSLEALRAPVERRQPVVFEPGSALMVDRAARVGRELGLNFLVLASGQEWRRPELAGAAGVPFLVPLNFPALPKLPGEGDWDDVTLDQLRVWDWAAENAAVLGQQGREIAVTTYGLADRKSFRKNLQLALDRGLAETDALAAMTTIPARLCGVETMLGTVEKGKIANLTVVSGKGYFDPSAKVQAVWIDGRVYPAEPAGAPAAAKEAKGEKKGSTNKGTEDRAQRQTELREMQGKRTARSPQSLRGPLLQPRVVLVKDATLWTGGPQGRLEKGSMLIVDGKIKSVGRDVPKADAGGETVEIDGSGLHVTPGLIDCHSHTAILGGVNESTVPSSAMVRIADVVNSETDNLYQQLAGGLTAANLLHGSANPIGGQNCVIKLKEGAPPEDLKIADAPAGIKFALGENVKQSNAGERRTTRFPQSRMGVPAFIANRFIAARLYLAEWEAYEKASEPSGRRSNHDSVEAPAMLPPRRDLELEALGEILRGKRLIHCHSYRQDEIAVFLGLMEDLGVKVATLQHVLEGYKVADEIARHGAGASCFSDWWAYKFEVYDAIPYAGSLMRERGALVSFNSDSSELARRMNLEAAKAVKYGGTGEEEALKFVTLNPARQLGIDRRVGSLEAGKDGDFVIWSGSPLDTRTVCLQTWIEGKKYFDREQAPARATALAKERADLIAKAKKIAALSGPGGGSGSGAAETARAEFFRRALEHAQELQVIDCLDCRVEEGRAP